MRYDVRDGRRAAYQIVVVSLPERVGSQGLLRYCHAGRAGPLTPSSFYQRWKRDEAAAEEGGGKMRSSRTPRLRPQASSLKGR